jgi:predicted DNA-binding protein
MTHPTPGTARGVNAGAGDQIDLDDVDLIPAALPPGLPATPEAIDAYMASLSFAAPPTPAEQAALLDALPAAGDGVMIVRSLRLPLELDSAAAAAAAKAGLAKTTWIRQAIQMALALQADDDQPISRADALRALAQLRPAPRHVA